MNLTIHFCRVVITAAAMLLCLTGIGCTQLSRGLRPDRVSEGELSAPSPELSPAPAAQTPLYVPPPAPPTEAAQRELREDFWSENDQHVASQEDAEFFPDATPAVPPSFIRQRGQDMEQRLAAEARLAAARREWEREHMLPVIVPASPALRPVSGEEPELLPVPW